MKLYFLIPLILQKLIWIPTRLILIVCGNLEVRGLGNLKGIQGPVIFACNHSSEIDPFMVPASLPFFSQFSPLFYAVRERDFYEGNGWRKHLFHDWFINMWGGYRATTGLRDYGKSLAEHIPILRDGCSFCVFPEGGITKDGTIRGAKGGISFLALSSPCTIVPAAISGVYNMSTSDFFLRKRNIAVTFGQPIRSDELYKSIHLHNAGENIWKKEADFIMRRVEALLTK